jgi:hypothetical protein
MRKSHIDASCDEDSLAGKFLGMLYYDTRAMDLFRHDERSGFPNDGGLHSLELYVPTDDAEAFLELVTEAYGNRVGCNEFASHFRSRMH